MSADAKFTFEQLIDAYYSGVTRGRQFAASEKVDEALTTNNPMREIALILRNAVGDISNTGTLERDFYFQKIDAVLAQLPQ